MEHLVCFKSRYNHNGRDVCVLTRWRSKMVKFNNIMIQKPRSLTYIYRKPMNGHHMYGKFYVQLSRSVHRSNVHYYEWGICFTLAELEVGIFKKWIWFSGGCKLYCVCCVHWCIDANMCTQSTKFSFGKSSNQINTFEMFVCLTHFQLRIYIHI